MSGIIAFPMPVTRQMPDCPIAFPALPQLEMPPALQQPSTSWQQGLNRYLARPMLPTNPDGICIFGCKLRSCQLILVVPYRITVKHSVITSYRYPQVLFWYAYTKARSVRPPGNPCCQLMVAFSHECSQQGRPSLLSIDE
ncbi:hypothetical protein CCMA1212_003898 [Trichoderma ghanense]|uniref:Uncharacterized protein n=1 Tax=Trichoderma ghanense TaxID=65468 RepID=A0ABY2H6V6_9HYPO